MPSWVYLQHLKGAWAWNGIEISTLHCWCRALALGIQTSQAPHWLKHSFSWPSLNWRRKVLHYSSLSFCSLFLFYSSLDPDFLAFASHAHPVQQLSQTQEVCTTSILFIGDQTWSWSRAWCHVQDLQQLGSLLYWSSVLVFCWLILKLTTSSWSTLMWFRLVCCRAVFAVLHFQTVGICFHSKLHGISMLALVLAFVAISRGLLLETLSFWTLWVMQTMYNIWVRHTKYVWHRYCWLVI